MVLSESRAGQAWVWESTVQLPRGWGAETVFKLTAPFLTKKLAETHRLSLHVCSLRPGKVPELDCPKNCTFETITVLAVGELEVFLLFNFYLEILPEILDSFPKLKAFYHRVLALPKVQECLEKDLKPLKPVYVKPQ